MLMEHLVVLAAEPSKHCIEPVRFQAFSRRTKMDAQRSLLQATESFSTPCKFQPVGEGLGNLFTGLPEAVT